MAQEIAALNFYATCAVAPKERPSAMNTSLDMMKQARRGLAAVTLAALLAATTACGNETGAPAPDDNAAQGVAGLEISNARLVLNPVKANPAAGYFDLSYSGDRGLSIRKAEIEGAGMTMMHNYTEYNGAMQMSEAMPVGIKNGSEISFEPGGLHLMAMEPSPEWEPGGTVKITLTMSGGATHSFDAEIRGPGDAR